MKEITNEGNLPKALRALAKEVRGLGKTTIFYEYNSASEVEAVAKRKECEELTCVLDPSTERGYLVGFAFTNPDSVIITAANSLIQMKIHFVELSTGDFKRYSKMLTKHKRDQEDDMIRRRKHAKLSSPITDGGNDD